MVLGRLEVTKRYACALLPYITYVAFVMCVP